MVEAFLVRYFPLAKTAKLHHDISSCTQSDIESLFETWEMLKDLLQGYPHYGFPDWMKVQMFYNGLNKSTCQMVDVVVGRHFTVNQR